MQQQQRFILFLILSMGMFFAWITLGPRFFPNMFPKPRQEQKQPDEDGEPKDKQKKQKQQADGKRPPVQARKPGERKDDNLGKPEKKKPPRIAKPKDEQPKKPDDAERPAFHPRRVVTLGSPDPTSGYFMEVELTSRGAAVVHVALNDDRYRELADRAQPLKVVGNFDYERKTFATRFPSVEQAAGALDEVDWKLEEPANAAKDGEPRAEAAFSYTVPGVLKLTKKYWLEKVDAPSGDWRRQQNTNNAGYELRFNLTAENLRDEEQAVQYRMQGPIGVPLEDLENVRVFRSVVTGFLQDDGALKTDSLTAKDLAKADKAEEWTAPVRYIGVDVQYFAALLLPEDNQADAPYLESVKTDVISAQPPEHSDLTLLLTSKSVPLSAAGSPGSKLSHGYTLYAGPKRKALLEAYDATPIIKYGTFGCFIDSLTGAVARGMMWLLNFFHSGGVAYGFAIILLTCCVRAAMLPLTRKQVASARKMKELQPRIAELKKKYGDDREKMAKAQMELFAKSGYNPLAGCLPIFLQLPIFIGLYQALGNAVELRLAPFPFTWIDNLAAPDQLFALPFRIWFLGSFFNLLPIITIFLFVAQQKMFMPPPADEQQAMQHKMMKYMSVFFGFLFYHVPSGLCIYFIASSIWGMAERKILDAGAAAEPEAEPARPEAQTGGRAKRGAEEEPVKPKGLFAKLMQMADDAAKAKAQGNGNAQSGNPKQGSSSGGGSSRRKKGKKRR